MKVFLVSGCSGDRSDYSVWIVAAYSDRGAADLHAERARAEGQRIGALQRETDGIPDELWGPGINAFDPECDSWGVGEASYSVSELDVDLAWSAPLPKGGAQ